MGDFDARLPPGIPGISWIGVGAAAQAPKVNLPTIDVAADDRSAHASSFMKSDARKGMPSIGLAQLDDAEKKRELATSGRTLDAEASASLDGLKLIARWRGEADQALKGPPNADNGFASPQAFNALVGKMKDVQAAWSSVDPGIRQLKLTGAVNTYIANAGTGTPSMLSVTTDPNLSSLAVFEPQTWSMKIKDLPEKIDNATAAKLTNEIAHEAQHAEQSYRMLKIGAQKYLEKLKKDPRMPWPPPEQLRDQIAQMMSESGNAPPKSICRKALDEAIGQISDGRVDPRDTWMNEEGRKSPFATKKAGEKDVKYQMGASAVAVHDALGEYNEKLKGARAAAKLASQNPTRENVDEAEKASQELAKTKDRLHEAYKAYREDFPEKEAHLTGALAEDAFQKSLPPEQRPANP